MSVAPRDDNHIPGLVAKSTAGYGDVILEADPTTKRLLVNATTGGLVPNVDYDYIDIQQTSATVETYVFKLGGAGGSTVQTIVVTYTSAAKTDLDTVEYS